MDNARWNEHCVVLHGNSLWVLGGCHGAMLLGDLLQIVVPEFHKI